MKRLTILGSTGSIGTQTLDVVRQNRDKFEVVAISANRSVDLLLEQIIEFKPKYAVLYEKESAEKLKGMIPKEIEIEILDSIDGLVKISTIDEVKNGDKVAVPNDSTNEARALKLLAKQGLIEVKDGELITVKDITKNPKNLKFVEVDAAQVPSTLDDVAIAVINTNYALNVGLNPTKDALAIESSDSPYVNIVAIRTEEKDSDKIKALTKALNSDEVKKFIEEKYNGSIVPAF